MADLVGNTAAKPTKKVRQTRVGGHDMVEDQIRGEIDSSVKAVLDTVVSMNPGLVCKEVITLAGGETFVTVGKKIATLIGVQGFANGVISYDPVAPVSTLGITAAAKDGNQTTNPGKIGLTGTVAAGKLLVLYLPL